MPPTVLQTRLESVVTYVFGGNVHAAATVTGVEAATLHRILDGKIAGPRLSTLTDLAQGFGLPLSWLIGELTTEQAQAGHEGIPEPVWLLLSYVGARRAAAKAQLDSIGGKSDKAHKIAQAATDSFIAPFTSPRDPQFAEKLLLLTEPLEEGGLELLRDLARVEVQGLELAVDRAKHLLRRLPASSKEKRE